MNALNSSPAATDARLDQLVCAALAAGVLPPGLDAEDLEGLWERARVHDVDVLVAALLSQLEGHLPPTLRRRAAERLREAQFNDILRFRELCRIAASFEAIDVDVLLLKGAALAHILYAEPGLRPSRDIDLFIRREARDAAERALANCGYARMREPDGELARAQRQYVRRDGARINHFVDLHWRASNVRLFADALSFDDAWSSSMVVPFVQPATRTLGITDALLLACIHRVAHHQDATDLLWLWDIHLLTGRLTEEDARAFVDRAERARVRVVVVRGLELSRECFGTRMAPGLLERLRAPDTAEPSARLVGGGLRTVDVVRADLEATAGLWNRATLLREHLFPRREYMRAMYTQCPAALLPIAYVDRIVRGAPKWFRRP